ncbi:hypothetical protein GCM10010428_25450 [Actinosynnema pretiosum subsp. pretiosum]
MHERAADPEPGGQVDLAEQLPAARHPVQDLPPDQVVRAPGRRTGDRHGPSPRLARKQARKGDRAEAGTETTTAHRRSRVCRTARCG